MINKLAIIGTGLIGGSLARALREGGYVREIVAHTRSLNSMKLAVELGVADYAETSIEGAAEGADMIIVSVPVGTMPEVFGRLAAIASRECIITDVGSVKSRIIQAAREALGEHFGRFVPGHPIAGTEQSGVASARADLFFGHRVILTPDAVTDPGAVAAVRSMWEAAGGIVREMTAASHDAVLAASSHLPHVLAYALVDMLVRKDEHREIFEFAAGGFRDFTRIASSDPTMWRDICLENREQIVALIENYSKDLGEIAKAISRDDGQWLIKTFTRAKHARENYILPPPADSPDAIE